MESSSLYDQVFGAVRGDYHYRECQGPDTMLCSALGFSACFQQTFNASRLLLKAKKAGTSSTSAEKKMKLRDP